MTRPRRATYGLVSLAAICLGASACAAPAASSVTPSVPEASPAASAAESAIVVRGTANIFGAGRETPPDPGGGGHGRPPAEWPLPPGGTRIVTFASVTGEVNQAAQQFPYNGPGGDGDGPTDIESFEGISGIVHQDNTMFLVGVFLTNEEPMDPAPERLDFTDGEDFDLLAPEIGQVFFIGDGVGRSYEAPPEATRLFLGFADALLFQGAPGWYGNNAGELQVIVEIAVE